MQIGKILLWPFRLMSRVPAIAKLLIWWLLYHLLPHIYLHCYQDSMPKNGYKQENVSWSWARVYHFVDMIIDSEGNFTQLLKHHAEEDADLSDWLET